MTREESSKKIGQRIIDLRTQNGWTQSYLPRACGKDWQAIEKFENGKVNPTIYSLVGVAKTLGVRVSEIINF